MGVFLRCSEGTRHTHLFSLCWDRKEDAMFIVNMKEVANVMDNVVFNAKDELSRASALGKHEVVDNLVYYYHNIDLVADEVAKNLHLDEDKYEVFYIQFEQAHKALMNWLDVICKMYQ